MTTNQPATKRDVGGQTDKAKDKKESGKNSRPTVPSDDKRVPTKKK
jgi:hypothetical protein